ncbi:colicin immunity domain-containing protein [Erwiniaceae bacterium BAC15a-03b]|uniref:Colicin immunity domain-containing protein n=1 Tax=Winslowiella arboricola TaxID=2978220 RepID=A0A9J6PSX9_9GAMM|nr:colicin immunity domain-containing protein [Winslowiella arboricola]MCU5772839.1 colicin immunity domain-containing protein [Winslowiella arboricola]MCU5777143.1 colicin immunity domain-containing protein [Winslowiella arboricola]
MSQKLLQFVKDYADGNITADQFADSYQVQWKAERDSGRLAEDLAELNEKLSTIFCLADQYNPEPDRHYSEYGADELLRQVKQILGQ